MTFTIFSITCLALVASALGCGVPAIKPQTIGSRILNGQNAISGSWPWQVSLQIPHLRRILDQRELGSHFCPMRCRVKFFNLTNITYKSGKYIHCLLSVGHLCIHFISISLYSAGYHSVILGEHNRVSNAERIQVKPVSKVITHPLYDMETFDNDIALLKLSSPVTFTPRISPVCLAESNASIVPGTRCFTTGWGKTGTTSNPLILQQTSIPIISPAVCRQLWDPSTITDAMICAGASGSSSCQGDAGGPLVCESSGVWTLVGSVSWGRSTCDPRFPAVYTNISKLHSWINETISSN
ncbi:chymotrypsin-like protease CTRL-1 [Carassius gibelio]|uniref:chymotrypsin-like protease CTRL-1 n=1 Tax=Carassius gibelio TaxID=101364 RepID=UPI002277FCBC|nr:chymotrypsin-like protease CTRL-1 [Carassius gibelio]